MSDLEIRYNYKPEIIAKRMSVAYRYLTKSMNDFGTEESRLNAAIAQRLFNEIQYDALKMQNLLTREEN